MCAIVMDLAPKSNEAIAWDKLDAFERLVREYEQLTSEEVSDDTKIGVIMLGMVDIKIKEHLVRNGGRLDTWLRMKTEIQCLRRVCVGS